MLLSNSFRSWRRRLPFLVAFLLLAGAFTAAPQAANAASVKQFVATINPTTATGQSSGSWTETVTNCGVASQAPCTASSTIAIGTIQIAVPTEFRPIASVSVANPPGQTRNWGASYVSSSGAINAFANTGSDKLQPGESLLITFSATPSICGGTKTFTTSAWGSNSLPGTNPFATVGNQPTVNINGCALTAGGTVTDPSTGETVTGNNFDGSVIVSFGGELDCSTDPNFGNQWSHYHLPNQVNISPGPGFSGTNPKTFTFKFNQSILGGDSSWYLICYNSDTPFTDKSGNTGVTTGLLPACYDPATNTTRPVPCVSEQFLTTNDLTSVSNDKVTITIRVPPGDPHGK